MTPAHLCAYELGQLKARVNLALSLLGELEAPRINSAYRKICVAKIRSVLTGGRMLQNEAD